MIKVIPNIIKLTLYGFGELNILQKRKPAPSPIEILDIILMDFLFVKPNRLSKKLDNKIIEIINKSVCVKILNNPVNGKEIIVIIVVGYPIKHPMQKSIPLILNVCPSNFSHNGWCLNKRGFAELNAVFILCLIDNFEFLSLFEFEFEVIIDSLVKKFVMKVLFHN
ncbi:hypothetical protein ES703_119643 [subsurface metagenome]